MLEPACPSMDDRDSLLQSRRWQSLELALRQLPSKFLAQNWSNLPSAIGSFGAWIAIKISMIYNFEISNFFVSRFTLGDRGFGPSIA
jgi:hypothetical protein